jgi:Chaperone of endosialidase
VNPTGDDNTLLGYSTRVSSGVGNGTAIGAQASVTQSNSLVLGSINVVIGTTGPGEKLQVLSDIKIGLGTTGCAKDGDSTVIAGTC